MYIIHNRVLFFDGLMHCTVGDKYYCYLQNAKIIFLPFKNGNFSNIEIAILDFSLLLPM